MLMLVCAPGCRKTAIATPPPALDSAPLADRFEQLIQDGCYLCLEDVLRESRSLPAGLRQAPRISRAIDRAALLFVLRTKELGIPPDGMSELAQTIVVAQATGSPESQTLVDVTRAIPWNIIGVGEGFVDAERAPRPSLQQRSAWRMSLASQWMQDDVAAYVYLSLLCSIGPSSAVDVAAIHEQFRSSPLILYRWATCAGSNPNTSVLRQLVAGNERFHEVHYVLGRWASDTGRFAEGSGELLTAWRSIPRFSAAGVLEAELETEAGAFDEALERFDAVLALAPEHFRAILGRLKTLSSAGRYAEAVAVADRLIAAGRWFQGDAYYWRAWNRYRLSSIDSAWDDVRAAKDFERSLRVFTLAGVLRMTQERWQDARDEFSAALAVNRDACDVRLYLGHVQGELGAWTDSGGSFEAAADCFARAERRARAQIATLQDPPPDAWSARYAEKLRRELADSIEQGHSSVYNAAVAFLNAGQPARARPFAERAGNVPEYAERAQTLLARMRDDR